MQSLSGAQIGGARWDVISGFVNWRLWAFLGLQDIRQRYRRSSFGPLWLMLGLGVTVLGIGILYSAILKTAPGNYVPFLAISLLLWNFFLPVVLESTGLFQSAAGTLRSIQIPYSSFVLRCITRNLIVAAHCVIVVVAAFVYYRYPVHLVALLAIPGLILLIANLYWISLSLSLICARYRDVGQIVQYTMSLALFLTPVIWIPSKQTQNVSASIFTTLNPLYHLLQIVRSPIFDGRTAGDSFVFCLVMLVLGLSATYFAFRRFRPLVIYWI